MVGKRLLSQIFETCDEIKDISPLLGMLEDIWGSMAMMDYPYPTDFIANVPAWPVTEACKHLNVTHAPVDLISAIKDRLENSILVQLVNVNDKMYFYTQMYILTTNVFFDDKRNFNDKMYFNFSK